MIALYPPPDLAEEIAIEGGLDSDDLHLTLAYTGPAEGVDRRALRKAAKKTGPIAATISGHARFTADPKQDAVVALVDAPAPRRGRRGAGRPGRDPGREPLLHGPHDAYLRSQERPRSGRPPAQ